MLIEIKDQQQKTKKKQGIKKIENSKIITLLFCNQIN